MVEAQFPSFWWAQNDSTLFISIEAFDVDRDSIVCKVEGAKFMIRVVEKKSDAVKQAELELFGDLIDESKRIEITGSRLGYFFEKKEKKEWDSLLKESKYKNRIHWDPSRLNTPESAAGGFDGMDFSNMMGGQDFGDDADFPTPNEDEDEDEEKNEDEKQSGEIDDTNSEVKEI